MHNSFATVFHKDSPTEDYFPTNQTDGYWTADSLYDTGPFYEKIPFETYVIGAIILVMVIAVAVGTIAFIRTRKASKKHK